MMDDNDNDFGVGMVAGIALTLLCLAMISACMRTTERDPNEDVCILGGYATWTTTGPEEHGLCLGVVDGEWQIEPLDDVRARLEER